MSPAGLGSTPELELELGSTPTPTPELELELELKPPELELELELKSPELELELELKPPELELELELIFWRFAGVGIGVGVETSGVGVDILEIGRSWSWSWSWNLWSWSWSWSWYHGVDPNPGHRHQMGWTPNLVTGSDQSCACGAKRPGRVPGARRRPEVPHSGRTRTIPSILLKRLCKNWWVKVNRVGDVSGGAIGARRTRGVVRCDRLNWDGDPLRRSQRATPRVRRAPMAPPLTSPTQLTFTHRFLHSRFNKMEGIVLVRPERGTSGLRRAPGTRPGRFGPQAQDWSPSQSRWPCGTATRTYSLYIVPFVRRHFNNPTGNIANLFISMFIWPFNSIANRDIALNTAKRRN